MAYRDDLEAAHIRIQALENELACEQARIGALRAELVHGGRRHPWGWLAIGGVATLVLVGAGAGQVLYAHENAAQGNTRSLHTRSLQQELHEVHADLAQAREDRRVAFEMMAHAHQRKQAEVGRAPDLSDEAIAGGSPQTAAKRADDTTDPYSFASGVDVDAITSTLHVSSDRAARVAVDGSSVHGWTPVTIQLQPGPHSINVIAADGESRTSTLRLRKGYEQRLVVRFD